MTQDRRRLQEPDGGRPGTVDRVRGFRRSRHLVMWAADTIELVEYFPPVERFLRTVTEQMTAVEGICWASHDLDHESVCFTLMVEDVGRDDDDDGLTHARVRAGRCLRHCLGAAGVLAGSEPVTGASVPPLRLRLDPWPLSLRRMRAEVPSEAGLN